MNCFLKLVPEYWERHFMAQAYYETDGFKRFDENLNYSADALLRLWPHRFTREKAEQVGRTEKCAASPRDIANIVYAGRLGNKLPDDGWRYRGRGWLMMTGRANYASFGRYVGKSLVNTPHLVAGKEYAQLSGEWWFMENVASRKPRTVLDITRIISGSGETAKRRQEIYDDEPWIRL